MRATIALCGRALRFTALGLFAGLWLASCAFDGSGGGLDGPAVCSSHGDCEAGLVCQANRCVDEATSTLPIALQLRFPEMSGELRQQVTGLVFEPGMAMPTIEPQPLVLVDIQVLRHLAPVAATARFRAQRALPGTAINVSAVTHVTEAELSLLPGVYEVTVRPAAETGLPPRVFSGIEIPEVPSDGTKHTVVLQLVHTGAGEKLVVVRGKLLLVYAQSGAELPAANVQVSAVSEDGTLVAQADTTCDGADRCDGAFELILPAQLPSETRSWRLVVEPTDANATLPRMTLAPFTIGPEHFAEPLTSTTDSITLDLGTQRVVGVPAFHTLDGILVGPQGEPVPGALISARASDQAGIEYSTSAPLPTSETGAFQLSVPDVEGVSVTLVAATEPQSPYGSRRYEQVTPPSSGPLTLALAHKPRLSGQVLGRASSVAGATLIATPLSESGTLLTSQVTTTTDDAGNFTVHLDPGSYQVAVAPPAASGLPRVVEDLYIQRGESALERTYELGRSSVVFGAVRGLDGRPAAGVTVEVFAHAPGDTRAVLIGGGTTDSDGVYRVIVPSPDDLNAR